MSTALLDAVTRCLEQHAPEIMRLDDAVKGVLLDWREGRLHFLVEVESVLAWHQVKPNLPVEVETLPVSYVLTSDRGAHSRAAASVDRDGMIRDESKLLRADGGESPLRRLARRLAHG